MGNVSRKSIRKGDDSVPAVDAVDSQEENLIRDRSFQLLVQQLKYRRYVQEKLGTDEAGLNTMVHVLTGGEPSPKAIAANLETSTAATSLVLNRLEQVGHISREPHATDRRRVVVVPSETSIDAISALSVPVREGIDAITAGLTPDERETVAHFLDELINVYDQAIPSKSGKSI